MIERLQPPPIRTSLQEGAAIAPGQNAATARTAKEWYLFWRDSGEQINRNRVKLDSLVTSGEHADRPAAETMPEGAMYIESDRHVIYQQQGDSWVYLAGVMLGTLSPDQRPTDLGANDAGFAFRAIDAKRDFYWSGSAWVETTAVGGTANLTHPNVVTKVGIAGQITEGGITDESAANSDRLHITSGGNVGINVAVPFSRFEIFGRATASGNSEPYSIGLRFNRTSTLAYIGVTSDGTVQISDAGGTARMTITQSGAIAFPNLTNVYPGAGTKRPWYDASDGYRMKFAE